MLAPVPDAVVPPGQEKLAGAAAVLDVVVMHSMLAPEPDGVVPPGHE
jgi:hypothetical protein